LVLLLPGETKVPRFIADFHIHSKYSRATSPEMDVAHLSRHAQIKGIDLLGTADFTHPFYLAELKEQLQPLGNGLFKHGDTHFILTAEVCNNFYRKGSGKRIHNVIFAPSFETVERINARLQGFGRLASDGRPQLKLSAPDLVKMVLDIDPDCLVIPAHIWTPWFSMLGANAGFDSVEECFQDQTEHIFAVETGLSSDPPMNWRLSTLDRFCLISNSDAHSPAKIGREANVFDTELDYRAIVEAIKKRDNGKFLFTVEFFPQEGKYHYDGHRKCDVLLSPRESMRDDDRCPKCGQRLTIGVMHRVEELADRPEGYVPPGAIPCKHLVPLMEVIAEAIGKGVDTVAARTMFDHLTQRFGSEFHILLDLPEEKLESEFPERVGQGIIKMRRGELNIRPGYDGVYGQVRIFEEQGAGREQDQLSLF
jgi:uncharacterized protein (TIGR00375 family)